MRSRRAPEPPSDVEIWASMITNTGESVFELQQKQPVLLVFLRHFGCTFCREAMAEIAKNRKTLEAGGRRIVFCHMGQPELAESFFKKYCLLPVHHVSDPMTYFYAQFGLVKQAARQVFSFMNFVRGFEAGIIKGHGGAAPTDSSGLGDGFQMPGVFLLFEGKTWESYVHRNPYDQPDYQKIMFCCGF